MIRPLQTLHIGGLQAPTVGLQAGVLPGTTGALQTIDMNAMMSLMITMMIVVMMMKMMSGAMATAR